MFLNVLLAFCVPWIFGLKLYKKDKKSILLLGPFGAVIAFTFDIIGQAKFWRTKPIFKNKLVSATPCHLGVYPVSAGYLCHYLLKNKINSYLLILLFSLFMTFFEKFFVKINRVRFKNGWNIYWSFISYVLSYALGLVYYKQLKKMKIL